MKTIYKYKIPSVGGKVTLPANANVLSLGVQQSTLIIWAEVDPKECKRNRMFEVFKTGEDIPEDMGVDRKFIGTANANCFYNVLHVFERIL